MVDAVMRRIEEEEAAAAGAARRRQHDTQADIQRFLAQQQELKRRCGQAWAAPATAGRQPPQSSAAQTMEATLLMQPVIAFDAHLPRGLASLITAFACRQREAEAAEERSIQDYMRKRREREAADAARKATKREAQDRWAPWTCMLPSWRGSLRGGGLMREVSQDPHQELAALPCLSVCLFACVPSCTAWLHPPCSVALQFLLVGARAYELLKAQQEEAARAKEEEEALLDLLRAELEAERARCAAEERRKRQEEMRAEMIKSNEVQMRLKVRGREEGQCVCRMCCFWP